MSRAGQQKKNVYRAVLNVRLFYKLQSMETFYKGNNAGNIQTHLIWVLRILKISVFGIICKW